MTERAQPAARAPLRGLYGITPDWPTPRLLPAVEAALAGGLRILQYRNKRASPTERHEQAAALQALCTRHEARLIVNDDLSLACDVGAAGVHLGREDGSASAARAALGDRRLLGISCYDDYARAEAAVAQGADYVAFGSVHPSSVKPDAVRAPLALFERARAAGFNTVAIGGITLENAPAVIAAGADALAVITALFHAADVRAAALSFARLFDRHVA